MTPWTATPAATPSTAATAPTPAPTALSPTVRDASARFRRRRPRQGVAAGAPVGRPRPPGRMASVHALLPPGDIALLREALGSHRYTSSGIAAHLVESATAATRRNDFRAALRVTEGSSDPLATLIRLFVCGQTE